MRLIPRIIFTAAVAALLMPTLLLRAAETAKPIANDDQASSAASQPTAMPYEGGRNLGTPRYELFMGYSYLRAMPELAAGNRMVYLNGGSTSLAFNVNPHLGLVGDFGGFNDKWLLLRGTGGIPSVNDENTGGSAFTFLAGPPFLHSALHRVGARR